MRRPAPRRAWRSPARWCVPRSSTCAGWCGGERPCRGEPASAIMSDMHDAPARRPRIEASLEALSAALLAETYRPHRRTTGRFSERGCRCAGERHIIVGILTEHRNRCARVVARGPASGCERVFNLLGCSDMDVPGPVDMSSEGKPRVRAWRWRVAGGKSLPLTRTLRVGEAAREMLMEGARWSRGSHELPLSLHGPTPDHSHARYLPEDDDRDGIIDHLTVFASGGLDGVAIRLFAMSERLFVPGSGAHDLEPGWMGAAPSTALFGSAKTWTSRTPYVAPWHGNSFRDHVRKELVLLKLVTREIAQHVTVEPLRQLRTGERGDSTWNGPMTSRRRCRRSRGSSNSTSPCPCRDRSSSATAAISDWGSLPTGRSGHGASATTQAAAMLMGEGPQEPSSLGSKSLRESHTGAQGLPAKVRGSELLRQAGRRSVGRRGRSARSPAP